MIFKHIHHISEKDLYAAYKLFFNTFSSKHRLKILNFLRNKARNVSEITRKLKMNQTHVSHNLKRLKTCGFITLEVRGKFRYYKLNENIEIMLKLIDEHMKENCLMIIKENKRREKW